MRQDNHKEMRKAAVILVGKHKNNPVIFLGKNFHPLIKNKEIASLQDKSLSCKLGLMFPAGKVDPTDESLKLAALRELSEETGGLFFCDEIESPWQTEGPEFNAKIKVSTKDLIELNNTPISLKMRVPWNNKILIIKYNFFLLKSEEVNLEKLNLCCASAFKNLKGSKFKVYREVVGYITVPLALFINRLEMYASKNVDEEWFFKNSPEEERNLLFKGNTSKFYFFNKRYFFAASKIVESLKKALN